MSQLQALIFDVDGTLAETERDGHRVAFNRAFVDLDLPWRWPEGLYGYLLEVGGGKERVIHYLERYLPGFDPQPDLISLVRQVHQLKSAHFRELMMSGTVQPRPGVLRLLQSARERGVRVAIATTSAKDNALALLQGVLAPDAPSWFEVIAAGDMVAEKKPAPDVYKHVLERLQLPANQCLAIEDSRQGLRAAHAAGIPTVVTLNDYTRQQDFTEARLVLNHLGEPHRPFEVLQGPPLQAYYFTLDLARSLISR